MTRCLVVAWLAGAVAFSAPAALTQEIDARPIRILVVNDDGYQAPGLLVLVDSLAPVAEVVVAAPLEQQSGSGHGITYRDPIRVSRAGNPFGIDWLAVDARPATVTRLALRALMDSMPDLVVSGINAGDNLGIAAWLSGTVAAAREGALAGLPAIAVSADHAGGRGYAAAAGFTRELISRLVAEDRLEPGMLLNVNVPAAAIDTVIGVKVAPMSLVLGLQQYERRQAPSGQEYFWDTSSPPDDDPEAGTDLYWFVRGYITITPLLVDQTDIRRLVPLREAFEKP